MNDTGNPAEKAPKKPAAELLLYRVVKVPEGKKCLRVRVGRNGWRWYPGHKPRLTQEQAAKIEALCEGALELIPEL